MTMTLDFEWSMIWFLGPNRLSLFITLFNIICLDVYFDDLLRVFITMPGYKSGKNVLNWLSQKQSKIASTNSILKRIAFYLFSIKPRIVKKCGNNLRHEQQLVPCKGSVQGHSYFMSQFLRSSLTKMFLSWTDP